jgi:hypothetical protein
MAPGEKDRPHLPELARTFLALDNLESAVEARMVAVRSEKERRQVDNLVDRAFDPPCKWDRKNSVRLLLLALKPDKATVAFKLRERVHHMIHHCP